MRTVVLLALLLRVTLIPMDSKKPNKVFYCEDARVFAKIGWFVCAPPAGMDVIWVDLSEREDTVVVEAIKDDLFL